MKHKRLFTLIVSVIMVLLIPIIIYLHNFNSSAFDGNFYKKEFLKYNVYTNLKNHDIEKINDDVLNYLKYNNYDELIKNDFFSQREKTHLLDVKNLIQNLFLIYYISLILFLLLFAVLIFLLDFNYKIIVERFFVMMFFSSLLTLLDAFLFFILTKLNFDFIFDFFHKTFFPIGAYMFNPELEKIVVLYPENLFFDVLIKIITKTIFSSMILFFISLSILFYFFKRNFSNFFLKIIDDKNNK